MFPLSLVLLSCGLVGKSPQKHPASQFASMNPQQSSPHRARPSSASPSDSPPLPDTTSPAGASSSGDAGGTSSVDTPDGTDAVATNPEAVFNLPMDDEWLADDSILVPPDADPDGDFTYELTVDLVARNYVNAKASKAPSRRNEDPYSATPPKLKSQVIKCNSVSEFRQIIVQRYGRAIMGRAVSKNMDLMLVPLKSRNANDEVGDWQLTTASVLDIDNFFYINHKIRLYFFFGTKAPAWAIQRKDGTIGRSLLNALNGTTFKLHICRLGFHLQYKPDYDAFVKAVREPRNTDRAGSAAQEDIYDLIRRMQQAHPNLSRGPPSSWQQWAAEIATLPRDRQGRAIAQGPPSTLPFSNAETEARRRLQNIYESNLFLEHIPGSATESLKKIDQLVDGLVSSMTKEFEKSLKSAAGKIKEEITKATLSFDNQAQVAHWNVGVMAPADPSMPPALVPAAQAAMLAARTPGSVQQFELESDEDMPDQDHTDDKNEWEDEVGGDSVGPAA